MTKAMKAALQMLDRYGEVGVMNPRTYHALIRNGYAETQPGKGLRITDRGKAAING